MKGPIKFHFFIILILGMFLSNTGFHNVNAQNPKKNKIRLKVDYVKIMNEEIYFNIKASSKIGKDNVNVANIELAIYNEVDDDEVELGTTITDMNGESRFVISDFSTIKADSTNTYNIGVSFNGNQSFKKASKSISFKDANIEAKLIKKDSLNYITATLKDASQDSLISGASLTVQVERLFLPLFVGEEFYITDENGTITTLLEDGIPGMDGNLNIEVVMSDNEVYGTVKDKLIAPVGTPIIDESTFDERTMWSPRNKTPLFLLIFPNLIIAGMWGLIIYLAFNLFKIYKLKN